MSNKLLFSSSAREKMTIGAKTLANAVKVTLGPKGRNVVIEQDFGSPLIVNDGVTIAKSITLEDKYENLGASILIEAATKTNDLVGDGTTTAILLTATLIEEGMKKLQEGANPVTLRNGLNFYLSYIHQMIDEVSTPVKSSDDLEQIATISSGSKEIGKLIREAYQNVGQDGIITIEESQGLEDYLDVVKGYSFDRGFLSSYMANNDTKNEAILDKPFVLVTDKKIISMQEVLVSLEEAIKRSKPLFIICDDIEQEVLGALVVNKLRGVFNAVVVKAPSFGERKLKQLKDVATITGAQMVDSSIGMELSNNDISVLGVAEKIIVSKDQTIIISNSELTDHINLYAKSLQEELLNTTSEYDKEKLEERIAKILGGIAQIKIGAETEIVLKEKKLRIEDALNATKAAMKSGIIEGGGKVLYQIANALKHIEDAQVYQQAREILEIALQQPFIQICENAGVDYQKILQNVSDNLWYDALNNKMVDMKQSGIIDPASVEKSAIMSAVSISGIFLTTECAIINEDKKTTVNEENLL